MPKPKPKPKQQNRQKSHRPSVGRAVGRLIGGAVGLPDAGAAVGGTIQRILGMGDYTVKGNSIMTNQAPAFTSTSTGVRVSHREFVMDVGNTQNFTNRQHYINPGNPALFRWLSGMAQQFETYKFRGLVFTYKPTSGTALSSSNAAMGVVVLSTEYDVLKPPFSSKQDAEAYQFTTSCVPYQSMIHPVECAPALTALPTKFVTDAMKPSDLAVDDDPRLHYQGLLQVMTVGAQTNSGLIGELWVSYDVEFFTPRPNPALQSAMSLYQTPLNFTGYPPSTTPVVKLHEGYTTATFAPHLLDPASYSLRVKFLRVGYYRVTVGVRGTNARIPSQSNHFGWGDVSTTRNTSTSEQTSQGFTDPFSYASVSGSNYLYETTAVVNVSSNSTYREISCPTITVSGAGTNGYISYYITYLGQGLQELFPPNLSEEESVTSDSDEECEDNSGADDQSAGAAAAAAPAASSHSKSVAKPTPTTQSFAGKGFQHPLLQKKLDQ
jgi:hypothetical protein